jgi:hypothetical protein
MQLLSPSIWHLFQPIEEVECCHFFYAIAACGRVFSKLPLQNSMEHEAMEGQF